MAATASAKTLQITIVTPARAVLDETAEMVILPMFDGELGVLPGRAPFVGQLGPGELRIKSSGTTRSLFIDGGFVQVRTNTVNVLTASSRKIEELTETVLLAEKTRLASLGEANAVEKATKTRAAAKIKAMERVKLKGSASH